MGIYEDNLKALKKNHSKIYDYMIDRKNTDKNEYHVENAKNGEPVLVMEKDNIKTYFNSLYNPSSEAERYMKEFVSAPDKSILVVFGLSTGCFAMEFLNKNNKDNYIVVYEPDINIFDSVINCIDITSLLNNARFILIVNGINKEWFRVVVSRLIESYNVNTNRHIVLPKYANLYINELNDMITCLNELYDKQRIFNNTLLNVGKLCCNNTLKNFSHLSRSISSNDLIGRFPEEMPGIVVSAGPSLTKNVHLLKQAKGKAFIVCTDSAINTVLATGVEPDMVVAVDFAKSVKLFTAPELKHIPFLADFDLNPEVLNYVKPETIVFTTVTNMWRSMYQRANSDMTAIDSGGSVATAAISNMVKWGFKKIILIGQDLAFTGNKIHAEAQDEEIIEINERDYEFVEGLDGDLIPVRKDYLQYLRWIEELGYTNKEMEIIDATEGGSRKKNTTIMTFEDAIDKYCNKKYDISKIIEELPHLFEGDKKLLIVEELENIKKDLLDFNERFCLASQLCDMGKNIMSSGKYEVDKLKLINEYIGKLDTDFIESKISLIVNEFIAEATERLSNDIFIEEEDEIAEAIRMYKKSEEYYNMIANAIPEMIDIIDDCLITI